MVDDYVSSAQPVGSKAVVRRGVKVSSATVRSEMSALEQMGMLGHPYTSAGRIPTEKGFRYYVDHLLDQKRLFPADQDMLEIWALR